MRGGETRPFKSEYYVFIFTKNEHFLNARSLNARYMGTLHILNKIILVEEALYGADKLYALEITNGRD